MNIYSNFLADIFFLYKICLFFYLNSLVFRVGGASTQLPNKTSPSFSSIFMVFYVYCLKKDCCSFLIKGRRVFGTQSLIVPSLGAWLPILEQQEKSDSVFAILIEHLLCAGHCARGWSSTVYQSQSLHQMNSQFSLKNKKC